MKANTDPYRSAFFFHLLLPLLLLLLLWLLWKMGPPKQQRNGSGTVEQKKTIERENPNEEMFIALQVLVSKFPKENRQTC